MTSEVGGGSKVSAAAGEHTGGKGKQCLVRQKAGPSGGGSVGNVRREFKFQDSS